MRIAAAIACQMPLGAIGVPGRAVGHAEPKHRAGPLRRQTVAQHFVARFAIDHRHRGLRGIRLPHGRNGHDSGLALAVRRLQHVEIQERRIVGGVCDVGWLMAVDAQASGWRNGSVGADISKHFGPLAGTCSRSSNGNPFHQIVRHRLPAAHQNIGHT